MTAITTIKGEMTLTRLDILRKYHDLACHNLYCYSANMLMSLPKVEYEKEWSDAKEEIKLLDEMISEAETK